MAINQLAPGVYSNIKDYTAVVDTLPSTTAFIALICEKGPDNTLMKVNKSEFYTLFGTPDINYTHSSDIGLGPYIASEYLEESSSVYVMRCLPNDSTVQATFSTLVLRTTKALLDDDTICQNDTDNSGINWISIEPVSFTTISGGDDANKLNDFTDHIVDYTLSDNGDMSGLIVEPFYWNSDETGNGVDDSKINLCVFYGIGRGEYYNNIKINIKKKHSYDSTNQDTASYYVYQHLNDSVIGVDDLQQYVVDIYLREVNTKTLNSITNAQEIYIDYQLVESFTVSFFPDAKDIGGNSIFVETVINKFSNLIRCKANLNALTAIQERCSNATSSYTDASTNATITCPPIREIDFSEGFYTEYNNENNVFFYSGGLDLSGGYSGLFDARGRLITDRATQVLAKAYGGTLETVIDSTAVVDDVRDTETHWFDLILDAGYPTDVKGMIVNLAMVRRDCLAILDNGDHPKPFNAIKTRQDTNSYATPYASLYEPYTKVYDPFTGKDLWMPPSFHLGRIFAFVDNTTEVWYAPAGFQRAIINRIKEMRYNCKINDREDFIRMQLNPIVKFKEGYVPFSQRTTMTISSARQDINVVRLIAFIERALKEFCRAFIFEFNDEETWNKIAMEVNSFLKEVKARRGLDGFSVKVGASEYDKTHRRCMVDIVLQPKRVIEQIHLNFMIKN